MVTIPWEYKIFPVHSGAGNSFPRWHFSPALGNVFVQLKDEAAQGKMIQVDVLGAVFNRDLPLDGAH